MTVRPMLGDVDLQQVQKIEVDGDQVLVPYPVPALEGDFFQRPGRRATKVSLTGVLTGAEVADGLNTLREKFRAAEPISFVADIATATKIDQVLIEELGVRELAGKPSRFEYALTLREFIPPPVPQEEPPPPPPPPPPPVETGTLIVEVVVEGQPDFDYSTVTVTVNGTQTDGATLSRTLTNRTNNIWTEENMPPGEYTVDAVVTDPQPLSGSATATVRAGQTTQVKIVLQASSNIAKAFVVHFRFDRAFLEPCLRQVLRQVAAYAAAHPKEKMLILGHTDLVGSSEYNQFLSERRARSIYACLTFGRDRATAVNEWDELRQPATGPLRAIHDNWGVREYQFMLQDLGYYYGNIDEIPGPNTNKAVRGFQQDNGLPVTGLMDDATWRKLVEVYLEQDALNVPENQFFRNAKNGCDGGILRWLGAGEKDPVKNTQSPWRPNRRTEILFVRADQLPPCEIPQPRTFNLPTPGANGNGWCLGPVPPDAQPEDQIQRVCFLTRSADNPPPDKWLVQPAEPQKITLSGQITFEDGTPAANAKYVLIAPDGEYLDGEGAQGQPVPARADAQGRFSYARQTPVGVYILEIRDLDDPAVARLNQSPPEAARGSIVCQRLTVPPPDQAIAGTPLPTIVAKIQPAPVPPAPANPLITVSSPVVVVKKTYTSPARVTITLKASAPFSRNATLRRNSSVATPTIRLFTAAAGGTEITFNGTDNVFSGASLQGAGVQLFAEASNPSPTVDDFQLTLTLAPGPTPVGAPATVNMTAVALTLDICMSRTAAGTDPAAMPQPPDPAPAPGTATDKWFAGRFVHRQDPGNHQGRALLIVRQVQPAAFAGDLVLRQVRIDPATNAVTALDAKVQIFNNELQTAGDAAKANPHIFNSGTIPAGAVGLQFWAEGRTTSAAIRDTGFQLGISGVEDDGDRVAVTVVQFSNLRADIPSTPAHTARLGNSPVARHVLTRGAGGFIAADFDEDFVANSPLVLIEGSVLAADPINFSVAVAPAGVPVSWSVQRDRRPAPNGDHPSIIALSPRPTPTLTSNAANRLQATLISDAVGSFHVRPFIDCNGNGTFEHNDPATGNRIDREPFMIMNLVLVRVTLNRDDSVTHNANFAASPAGGGISVRGGSFNIANPATAAIHMNVQADIVGGGDDGTKGLDRVFAGWVNNESANEDIRGTFTDTTVAPPVNHQSFSVFASNRATATGGTAASPVFLPGDPAPALVAPPLLDTGQAPNGAGGDTACLTRSRIRTRINLRTAAAPAAVGQRLLIESVDSPGDGENATHPGFPAARLVRFRFGLDFSAFLCFWTNAARASGATGDPADRLYTVLRQIDWRMRGEWTINPATGAITIVTAPTVNITARTPFNPIAAAVNTPAEVRPPTGLNLLARDARA